jgi:hypothetical protein
MVISTVPADPAGAVATMAVSETIEKVLAAVAPKLTAEVPVKLVPMIVTTVPPAIPPEVGDTLVTAGAGAAVKV